MIRGYTEVSFNFRLSTQGTTLNVRVKKQNTNKASEKTANVFDDFNDDRDFESTNWILEGFYRP